MITQKITYPTEWTHGKPRGSIKECPTYFMLTFSLPNEKQITKSFSKSEYGNLENALNAAHKYRMEKSDEFGMTRNKLRYINKDTIEVNLTQDQVMITDATNIDKVEQYPLNVKAKKVKGGIQYYAMYQDKKDVHPFTKLLGDFKTVTYINGNTLDTRRCNIKECGSVEKTIDVDDEIITNQSKYFGMKYDELPKNIWLLGKPSGTVFRRDSDTTYSARVADKDDKQYTKTFSLYDYKNDDDARTAANKWQIETSYKLGVTKNLIRIIDNETIEIQLTKGNVTKTDKIFIPVVQRISMHTTIGGGNHVRPYAHCSFNNINIQYHSLITNYTLVDHINGDTLDNRLCNLRPATYSMNNTNKHDDDTIGISLIDDEHKKYYKVTIGTRTKHFSKLFMIDDGNKNDAKQKAYEFRATISQCIDIDKHVDNNTELRLLEILKIKLDEIKQHTINDITYDKHQYLKDLVFPEDEKDNLFDHYFTIQMIHYNKTTKNLKRVEELLKKKLGKKYNLDF